MSGHQAQDPDAEEGALPLAVTLTALAGFVDACAFVRFSGLFVSFMSGNSTELAALPSEGRLASAGAAAGVVVLFVMGAFSGRLIGVAAGAMKRPVLMVIVSALLTLSALSAFGVGPSGQAASTLSAAAMALAMGAQNSVLNRVGSARASLTYVTGTLVNLGHSLADALMGEASSWATYLLMWLGLVSGAAVGALATERLGAAAVLAPAAVAALLALRLGALVRRRQATGRSL